MGEADAKTMRSTIEKKITCSLIFDEIFGLEKVCGD
jgi:hypothetical protein